MWDLLKQCSEFVDLVVDVDGLLLQVWMCCVVCLVLYLDCFYVQVMGCFLVFQCVFYQDVVIGCQFQLCEQVVEYLCIGFGVQLVEYGYLFDGDYCFEVVFYVQYGQYVVCVGFWCIGQQEFVVWEVVQCGQIMGMVVDYGFQIVEVVCFVQEVCGVDFMVLYQFQYCVVVQMYIELVQLVCFFGIDVDMFDYVIGYCCVYLWEDVC